MMDYKLSCWIINIRRWLGVIFHLQFPEVDFQYPWLLLLYLLTTNMACYRVMTVVSLNVLLKLLSAAPGETWDPNPECNSGKSHTRLLFLTTHQLLSNTAWMWTLNFDFRVGWIHIMYCRQCSSQVDRRSWIPENSLLVSDLDDLREKWEAPRAGCEAALASWPVLLHSSKNSLTPDSASAASTLQVQTLHSNISLQENPKLFQPAFPDPASAQT